MDSPPIDNRTDFEAHPQVLVDRDGERLVVVVKATYELRPDGVLEIPPEESRRVVRAGDVTWGEPDKTTIAYPNDVCVRKPGTDVVVVARGYAPRGVPVPTFDAGVRVGLVEKYVRVFGLRVWEAGGRGLTPPRPISEIELRYEHAWGGTDASDPARFLEEPRNPMGMGLVRDPAALTHKPAPQIEDPAHLLSTSRTRPPPAGLAPIAPHWEPRRSFAGTWDEAWSKDRAPLPPLDFDDRHNLVASPGLHVDVPLLGDEPVALWNLVPGGGPTTFVLPSAGVEIAFAVAGRTVESFVPHLDTVVIDALQTEPDEPLAVELLWRASVKAPRRAKDARIVVYDASKGDA